MRQVITCEALTVDCFHMKASAGLFIKPVLMNTISKSALLNAGLK